LSCDIKHINGEPTGRFTHPPEPTKENLTELVEVVKREGADIGFAQDPDADRLAIVDDRGEYIGEEYTLVLAAEAVLAMGDGSSCGTDEPARIATNLSTSRMMDDAAARHKAVLHRSAVGEANVVQIMKTENAIVGGEGNGGVIWPRVTCVRDSLSGMALVLSLLASRKKSLSALINDWPRYAFVKSKIAIREGLAERAIAALAERFAHQSLGQTDGIRIDFDSKDDALANVSPGHAWLHVRASNTEPILRVLAEAPTADDANALIAEARQAIERLD